MSYKELFLIDIMNGEYMKKLILLLCLLLLIGCNETVVEPYNLGGDNLGIKSIVIKKYNRQNDEYILAGHYLEEYNKKGLLTTRIEYNLMEEGKIYSKHERFYDENDNILKSLSYTNGELEYETIYTYKKKRIQKVENYMKDELVHTTTYEYKKNYEKTISMDLVNDTENVSEKLIYDDGSYIVKYEIADCEGLIMGSFEFNSDNQMIESSSYRNDTLVDSAVYEYNNNRTKMVMVDSDGVKSETLFVYDEYENMIRHENNRNGSDWLMEFIYEYDDKGNYILKTDKMFGELSRYEERTITYWD